MKFSKGVPNKTVLFHISKNGDVSVCTSVLHSCTCALCENSDSVRNKNPKSLQVVLCVCAHVCMCVHSCTCTLCKNSASGTSPVSVCMCVCAHVSTFMHMYAL